MTPEPNAARRRRRCLTLLGILLLLPVGGCGLLADEFMWLDRCPCTAPDAAESLQAP